jgi:hypothetical protein
MTLYFIFKDLPATDGNLVFDYDGPKDRTATISGSFQPLTASLSVNFFESPEATISGTFTPLQASLLVVGEVEVAISGTFQALSASISIDEFTPVEISGTFAPLTAAISATYSSNAERPVVSGVTSPHQVAIPIKLGAATDHQSAGALPAGWANVSQEAADIRVGVQAVHAIGLKLDNPALNTQFQQAERTSIWSKRAYWQDAVRLRDSRRTGFQEAVDLRNERSFDFQDMQRDRRPSRRTGWHTANRSNTGSIGRFTKALRSQQSWWQDFQAARAPNGGVVPPVEPVFDPCYLPDADLVFQAALDTDSRLLFVCERHPLNPTPTTVVVPIRSVYVVINDVSLRRVAGNVALPTLGLSLSIDADSWTWGFQASLPASTLDALQPTSTGPVELEASVNGNLYRVLAESISRERTFGSSTIRVSGRGKTALLSAPYAPVLTFANAQQRTAQQLMADVLTFNNVPLAWTIDWQLTDWLVPAGTFAATGTYIDGLTAIAGAAGAYLQPHPTAQQLSVLLKYPVAPWDWQEEVTPDFQLPASVTVQEGIEWINKPDYNRVFVSGTKAGVLGQVTRTGTAGDLPAQMVTDALITHADAARQRGLSILGDTGKQAKVRLRLPVLPATGVITPGKFVEYVDGTETRLGIVRSTSIDAGYPDVWQSLELETHL